MTHMSTKNIALGIAAIAIVGLLVFFWIQPSYIPSFMTDLTGSGADQSTTSPVVQAQEVSIGTGKLAEPGKVVSVIYVGQLQNGTVFDSSAAHGNQPLVFQLGAQGLIPGFQIGVNGMKEGGERIISIPPDLAYGAQDVKDEAGKIIIPANSTIVFDIKLVKVEDAPTGTATSTR